MANKHAIFQFYTILKDYSDEEHPLNSKQIIDYMANVYGQEITRQTVYNYISCLEEFNYSIIKTTKGYYLVSLFEPEEVDWLYHSIVSNGTLPNCYSRELIKKLMNTQSIYKREVYKNKLSFINVDKKENKDVLYSLGLLNKAIQEGCSVTFIYTRYNADKVIVDRRDELYRVIPLTVMCKSGKMYIACTYENSEVVNCYRLDRIRNLELSEKVTSSMEIDPYTYVRHRPYMYNGNIEEFVIKCDNVVIDDVIEMFGMDVDITKIGDDYNEVIIFTTRQELKFFVCQFVEHVELLSPKEIRAEIYDILNNAATKYKN